MLDLTLACDVNDRTRALFDGTVEPSGINLTTLPTQIEHAFWRMSQFKDFDASEMSLSTYITMRAQGNDDFVAIPAFPSRFFRHSCIFVNADAGIDEPADLRGKEVGIPEYQMTAALWIRGMLRHDHGVEASDVRWRQGGLEEAGREQMVEPDLPAEIELDTIPEGRTLSEMIEAGDIDALVTARHPSSYETESVDHLFEDHEEVERDYFRRTGMFPIMHTIVLDRETYDDHPWIAQELFEAFTEAKDICMEQIDDTGVLKAALPWLQSELRETRDLMGRDYWPYGVEDNRDELEAMTQYAVEQGLAPRKVDVGDLFAPTTYRGRHRV